MILLRLIFALALGFGSLSIANAQEVVFQPEPRPMPAAMLVEDGLRLEVYFSALQQGGLGLLRLSGAKIGAARFSLPGDAGEFFEINGDAWYGLLRLRMDAPPRGATLTVEVERAGETVIFEREIGIEPANYIVQDFEMPAGRAYLADPDVEAAEFARLDEIVAGRSPLPLWDAAGFALPMEGELTSPFGAFRRLGDLVETRHTGWDQRAPEGAPVRAMAAGRVAFAGLLEIRGNTVMINHGLGIYSGYAHLSELLVADGQVIAAGQIVGMSGNTGRSSAPHLHWEIVVRGHWIDGLSLLDMWLPA